MVGRSACGGWALALEEPGRWMHSGLRGIWAKLTFIAEASLRPDTSSAWQLPAAADASRKEEEEGGGGGGGGGGKGEVEPATRCVKAVEHVTAELIGIEKTGTEKRLCGL